MVSDFIKRVLRRRLSQRRTVAPAGPASLRQHSEVFNRRIVEVVPGFHVAIGYGLANVIIIEGDDSFAIVDTLESDSAAAELLPEIERIAGGRPLETIVYTHNHTDHIYGSTTLGQGHSPEVLAHETTSDLILKIAGVLRPVIYKRSMRQFGTFLDEGEILNAGIGPKLDFAPDAAPNLLWPTKTLAGRKETTLAGHRVIIGNAPGETPDHLYLYFPDHGLLIPGDNYYQTFPNLYAIRGTAYRDVLAWARSVETLLEFDAQHLVPCHTGPVSGKAAIRERLEDYRDAIRFVHDQTVRWMNRGLTPDEIVQRVKLPDHLAEKLWLKEHYGRVDWSVRSIYSGYLGWFSGDAAELHPLPPPTRARRYIELAGGRDALLREAQRALPEEPRWSAELSSHLLAVAPEDEDALAVRASALRAIADGESSANGRNYLLTAAREADGSLHIAPNNPAVSSRNILPSINLATILRSMAVNLNAERASDMQFVIGLEFPDVSEHWSLELRRGVCVESRGLPSHPDATIRIDSMVFKEMLTGARNPAATLASSAAKVRGDRIGLVRALLMFDADV